MGTKKSTAATSDTDNNISLPQDDADEKRLELNKHTLQDLNAAGAHDDKVRGGRATIRNCI